MAASAQWTKLIDRERWTRLADGIAAAVAVSLPWSTSATGILLGLWLIVVIPTLDPVAVRRVLLTPAGGLPVLLWMLGLVGMLWAVDLPLAERLGGLKGFHKLLFIPLLIAHFQRSERGAWVLNGFVVSCLVMLVLSWTAILFPRLPLPVSGAVGILVKDYVAQNAEFTACAFLLAAVAFKAWQDGRRGLAAVLTLLALAFVANMFEVTTSRTALVVLPVLLLLFAGTHLSWKGTFGLLMAALIFGAAVWSLTPALRASVTGMWSEIRDYRPEGVRSRAGERLEFWHKSIGFIAEAPLIGHGTGSIAQQFRQKAAGQTGMAGLASTNPHNQTFAVAIQLGLLGAAVLFAMWFAHVLLFARSTGFAAWAGLVIVTQNIVGSLFNSHLFDFTHGWGYVVGAGVAAGMVFKNQTAAATTRDEVR
jgi:O-antigen ligase